MAWGIGRWSGDEKGGLGIGRWSGDEKGGLGKRKVAWG